MNFTATICTQEVAEMSLEYLSDSQELRVHTFQAQKEFIRVYKLASSTRVCQIMPVSTTCPLKSEEVFGKDSASGVKHFK